MSYPKELEYSALVKPIKPVDTRSTKYSSFTYWSKKPENVVRDYINYYSRPGEIILDPFSGSGVTAIESLILRRKAIAFDINPLAIYFARMLAISPINLDKFDKTIEKILEGTKNLADELYSTKCRYCNKTIQIYSMLYEREKPKQINYVCSCRKGTLKALPDEKDLKKANFSENLFDLSKFINTKLVINPRKQIKSQTPLDYFTWRNLTIMEHIWSLIQKEPPSIEKQLAEFCFLSKLRLMGKDYFRSTSNASSFLWIPKNNWIERNVFIRYFHTYQEIRKAKEQVNDKINSFYREAKDPKEVIDSDKTVYFGVCDARTISNILPTNSIDYILTDPPYLDQALYLEYSLLWQPWFPFNPDFNAEIVVTDSPIRPSKKRDYRKTIGSGEIQYLKDIKKAFTEMRKVLRNNCWLSVWFRCKNDQIWNGFITALRNAGLKKIAVIRQPITSSTWNKGINPRGTLNEYLILSYRKTNRPLISQRVPNRTDFLEELYNICQLEILKGNTKPIDIWSSVISYFLSKYDQLPKELAFSRIIDLIPKITAKINK